jgi:apolipoprotein N-acyltransferase
LGSRRLRSNLIVARSLQQLKTEDCTLANFFALRQSNGLKNFSLKSGLTLRLVAAALGGFLLTMAFPSFNLAGAAWIGPGMILFSAMGARGGRSFWIGFTGGFVHFLSSLYWLLNMPFTWHGIPLAPAAGWLALSAYCALYFGLWVWLCWKLFPGSCATANDFLNTSWVGRVAWAFGTGAAWTALEFARGRVMTGFPWNFVGASQFRMTPLIQIAAFTGVYGVSFLVVWASVSFGATAVAVARRPNAQSIWLGAGLPLLTVIGVETFGITRLMALPPQTEKLPVALIQPGIPQTEIWDQAQDKKRLQNVLDLSDRALASSPRLLLWPESAVPDLNPDIQQSIAQLLHPRQAWLVFCAGTAEPSSTGEAQYFNSALLSDPDGALEGVYHKRRLVIFGEYIPLVRWLPFLKWLTPIGGELTPGDHPVEFEMKNPPAKMSVLICFEDMFADEARQHVGPDTDFLVNLTDDGWFGHAAEQWQQAASGIFRAVENGVPILRCTYDGLTCWADAEGRIREVLSNSGSIYGPGFIVADVPLRPPGDHHQTFYNLHGDWFPAACGGLSLGWLLAVLPARRKTVPK